MTTAERRVIDSAVHTLRPDAELVSAVRWPVDFHVRRLDAARPVIDWCPSGQEMVDPRRSVAVTLRSGMDRILKPHRAASVSEEEKGSST